MGIEAIWVTTSGVPGLSDTNTSSAQIALQARTVDQPACPGSFDDVSHSLSVINGLSL